MARETVVVSDLTRKQVKDSDRVSVIVCEHPELDEPVRLDAGANEVTTIAKAPDAYVVLEIQDANGSVRKLVDLDQFNALFTISPAAALAGAEKVSGRRVSQDSKPGKRDPEELSAMRTWARANGWPNLKDKGRVPIAAEQAYTKANKQAA